MNTAQLQTLASIHIGTHRTDSARTGDDVRFLQTGDIDSFGRLLPGSPKSTINMNPDLSERARVQWGDVLLANKGPRNIAIFYRSDYPRVVASGAFYIIKVYDPITILPEFLVCYLNLPSTQYQLQVRIGTASTVPTLNKKDLLDLPVLVPPLETQRSLVELNNSFLDIYDRSLEQLNLHQALLRQCFSTTLQLHH